MNKMQEELFKSIQSVYANEKCLSITLNHMKGFAEWLNNKYEYVYQSDKWVDVYSYSIFYTTEQLIEIYIKQL